MKSTKTLSITSGKGGVGKTTLACNIAYALARRGKKVLVLDGDLGMANADIMFGIKSEGSLVDVLNGDKTTQEIITAVSPNIDLISGGTGIVELNRINAFERRALLDSVRTLEYRYDYLLIDTAPGISDNVLFLNAAAQVSTIVINPDPASLADSYALIKVLNRDYKETKFSIICNQVKDEAEGLLLFQKFSEIVHRFLFIGLDYMGHVPQDQLIKRSTLQQRLVLKHEPQAESSRSINDISLKIEASLGNLRDKSGLNYFWEQVVGVA